MNRRFESSAVLLDEVTGVRSMPYRDDAHRP